MVITQATADRGPLLAAVLARAFVTEPMLRWTMGGSDDDLAERLTVEFGPLVTGMAAHGMVWEAGDGLGLAGWVEPGRIHVLWESQASSELVDPLTSDGGARRSSMWAWVESHIPKEPLWFLDHLGVEPAAQGQGAGSALIRHGLARADADGVDAFLETGTAHNVGYYERFGFSVVSEGDAPGGGPHIWFLRRPSRGH